MDRGRGGRSTPSYREIVVNKGKTPLESGRGNTMVGGKNREEETESNTEKEKDGTKDKEENDKIQETKDRKQKGPCKPRAEITPRVILNNPELQAHREHMQTLRSYANS